MTHAFTENSDSHNNESVTIEQKYANHKQNEFLLRSLFREKETKMT
jgi:hypothetical protein